MGGVNPMWGTAGVADWAGAEAEGVLERILLGNVLW
jgi:hypothetical protein